MKNHVYFLAVSIMVIFFAGCAGNMFGDIGDDIGEYNYFLAVNQSSSGGKTSIYLIEKSGLLGGQLSAPFYTGATPNSVAAHPCGDFLYVSYSDRYYIDVYSIASDGSTALIQSTAPSLSNYSSSIKIHPSGKYLYCAIGAGSLIAMYYINDNGTLSGLRTVSTLISSYGATPGKLAVAPSGNYLYAVTSNALVGYIINPDGTLPSTPSYEFHGTYNDGSANYALNYNNLKIIVDPAGHVYTFGNDTRALAYIYLLGFDKTLTLFDVNASSADQGFGFGTWITSWSVIVNPSGNILYLGVHQSTGWNGNRYYAYKINQNGTLDLLGSAVSIAGMAAVSGLDVNPKGDFLYAANDAGSEIEAFKINSDGSISGLTQTVTGIANASNLAIIRRKK